MITAIAALNNKPDSEISPQAGRAPYLLLFDETGTLENVLKNPFKSGGGGAGFGVAKMLADNGVSTFVAGKIGDNMREALDEKGIQWYEMGGSAEDAL